MGIDLIKDMAEAVKATARQQERTSPYDTSAVVRRIEGGTAWVHIPGGVDETPVRLTIACKPGDTVQVRVGGGSAWLVGNASAPPTDDTRANEIYELLKKTRKGLKEVIKNEVDEMIDDGEVGKGILKVVIEHCLANARNIPIGGTFADIQFSAWQELLPAYVAGKFYWARIVTYYADGTVEYGPPYFDMGAQVTAEVNIAVQEAQDTADEAERIAQEAAQTAGASRKVFNATPVPPYGVNDMWFDGPHGITYLCSTAKAEGESFAQSDWTEYSEDVSSHFWTDASGAHIAENQGDVTTGASQTISSTGTVMMRDGKVITSWTGTGPTSAAINFYDCSSASERVGDLIASYGRAGITHYINNVVCQALTASGLSFFNPDTNNHYLEAVFGPAGVNLYAAGVLALALASGALTFYDTDGVTELAEFGSTSAQIGKDGATHTTINSGGMEIYGGDGTEQLAHFGPSGVQLYALGVLAMALASGNMKFYDIDGTTELAEFGRTSAQIGKDGATHTTINSGGMEIFGGDGTEQLAHIGYGSGNAESGTAVKPYFTFGIRDTGAVGNYSAAFGAYNIASGYGSYAEGLSNKATGNYSHAEGGGVIGNTASGPASHVEGEMNSARGAYSHVGGLGNTANYEAQTVIGEFAPSSTSDDLFIVGNGANISNPSSAMRLKRSGRVEFAGAVGTGLQFAGRTDMVAQMKNLSLHTPYSFKGTDVWTTAAGAGSNWAFGVICKLNSSAYHMFFMTSGTLYKSTFAVDSTGNDGTFTTTSIA